MGKRKSGVESRRMSVSLPTPPADSADILAWLDTASAELRQQGVVVIGQPAALRVRVGIGSGPPTGPGLDAIEGKLRTLLTGCRVIDDESVVVSLRLDFDRAIEPGRCHVDVWRTTPPHKRLPAVGRERVAAFQRAQWQRRAAAASRSAVVCTR